MKVDDRAGGTMLRQARLRAGLSQSELARRTGIAQSVISVYESGRRQPALPTLAALIASTDHDLVIDVRPVPGLDRLTGPIGQSVRAHRSHLKAKAAAYGATGLAIFGSVSRGEDHPDSGIDLLVDLPDKIGILGLGRLREDLEAILSARVDLVPASDLKPGVRDAVEADMVAL